MCNKHLSVVIACVTDAAQGMIGSREHEDICALSRRPSALTSLSTGAIAFAWLLAWARDFVVGLLREAKQRVEDGIQL